MKSVALMSALFAVCLACLHAAAPKPSHASLGGWKLNLAKSQSEPGPLPQSQNRTDQDRGANSVEVTVRGVDAKGKATFTHFTWKYDGKKYPYSSSGQKGASTIAGTLAKDGSVEFTIRENNKVVVTGTQSVSPDGKTLTRVAKSADGSTSTLVYDRERH